MTSIPVAKLREIYDLLNAATKEAERSARITNSMLEKLKKHESLDAIEFVKLPSATNRTYEKIRQASEELCTIPPLNSEKHVLVCNLGFKIPRCVGQEEGPSASLAALAKALYTAEKKTAVPTPSPADDEDLYA